MKNYELIYVLRPNLDDEAKTVVLDKVKAIIEASGEVEKVDVWGVRRLAYEIQKLNEGFYVLVTFKASTDLPKELDRNLKISDSVIRHMIINLDEK
ncbi:MAG: 30S ribosomal protein S6 [Proteocatella sp.]